MDQPACLDCGVLLVIRGNGRGHALERCDEHRRRRRQEIVRASVARCAASRRPCPLGRATRRLHWDDPIRVRLRTTKRTRRCGWCDHPIRRGLWCSTTHRHLGRGHVPLATDIEFGTCRECGDSFIRRSGMVGQYCSRGKCAKRAEKRTRRHRLRAAGKSEHFTLREIAERDGWRCHLCRHKINPALDPQHDRAASIDHLIPVSDGGEHVRENVAIAHRDCNWRRSTGGDVQLRLTA